MPNTKRLGQFKESGDGADRIRAFVPPPLPPDPPLRLAELLAKLGKADRALGRLDGVTKILPDKSLFIYMYVRKEAVLSSQIEGTQSTLDDLLRFESEAVTGNPIDDIREVSNYVAALDYGVQRLATLPLSLRLIEELHGRLLQSGRGQSKTPGEFRRIQNYIGGTRPGNATFVPPPIIEMKNCLSDFEKFLHSATHDLPPLIKAGLIHVQFETIHPFLDGNGRIGRLLITLYLCAVGVMTEPLLYLSLYFKQHRADYYRLLQEVRTEGAWEAWLEFFLDGVATTADQAFGMATAMIKLLDVDRSNIQIAGDRAGSTLRIHAVLQKHPYLTARQASADTGLTIPTVNTALAELVRLNIATEVTGKKRGRVYAYTAYLKLLNDGTAS
jgi:Fic family protein